MYTARVLWTSKEEFLGVTPSGHAVPMDADRETNVAPGPMDLLLVALGACSATDVISILTKKRLTVEALEIEVNGERAEKPPRVWKKIDMLYKLRGALNDKAVTDAIKLSQDKYCSVAATLRKTATITYRHQILPRE